METTLLDCGCDALSVTANDGTEAARMMRDLYEAQFAAERKSGNDVNNIAPSGYRGDQCGRVFLGDRAGHLLYQARGTCAQTAADRLVLAEVRPHVTRLDWQATFKPPCTESEAARRYRRLIDATTSRSRPQSKGRGVVYQARDMANSYCLVSGSGRSYWRTYNKSRESPDIYTGNVWRHEWEIKGKRAVRSWSQFCESRDQKAVALATLRGFLLKCGLDEPCLREVPPIEVTHGRHVSDTERRIQWLKMTAAPVIGKLLGDTISMREVVAILTEATGVNGYFVERDSLEESQLRKTKARSHRGAQCQLLGSQ